MASGTIKGITIEIEGKTSGLVKSLGDVNKSLSNTQNALKNVDKALKLDPGNVDALKSKQALLADAIEETKKKLELEEQAAKDAAKALEEGTITKQQYDILQGEVAKTAAEMNKLETEAEQTNKALEKTADTGRFEKLKDALGKVGKGLEVAGKVTGAVVTGATAAAGGLVKLASSSAETADEIDKMSQKIGISKQAYQEWAYVMGQSGMDVDVLQSGMKTLNTQILKAQSATDKSSTALGKLGVSVTDSSGKLRSQEDILYDTIKALAGMDEGADRAKLAQELLGKSGSELAPLLNGGSKAIEDLTKRSHDLGLIMSDEAVDAGVKLGDTMDDVKKSAKMLVTNLGSALAPVIQKIADKLMEFMPRFQQMFDRIAPVLSDFLDQVLPVLMDLAEAILPPLMDLVEALLPPLTDLIKAILPVLVDIINTLLPPLIEIVQAIMPVLVEIINALTPILKAVMDILKPIIDLVLALIKPLLDLIKNILKPLTDLFSGVGDVLSGVLGPAIDAVSGLVSGVLGPVFEAIGPLVSGVVSLISGDWEGLNNALKGLWENLSGFAQKIWKQIGDWADSAVEAILGAVNMAEAAEKGHQVTRDYIGKTQEEIDAGVAKSRAAYEAKRKTSSNVSSGSSGGTTNVYVNGVRVSSVNNATNTQSNKRRG